MGQLSMRDLGCFGLGGRAWEKTLETASKPHVLDTALLYVAPWSWAQKQKAQRKEQKLTYGENERQRQYELQRMREEEERFRREEEAKRRARKKVYAVQKRINDSAGWVNHSAGEAIRLAQSYNLSPQIKNEAQQLVEAAMTLALQSPGVESGMSSDELATLALQLEDTLGLMDQLALRAETVFRTALVYRR